MACCSNPQMVTTEAEVVCSNCGVTSDELIEEEVAEPLSKVSVSDEEQLGSADIDPSHILSSRTHKNILRAKKQPLERKLADTCNKLGLQQAPSRRALYLFRRFHGLKHSGTGNIAFFSIYQTCRELGIKHTYEEIIQSIMDSFKLKRRIKPQKAIFTCENLLVQNEMHMEIPKPDPQKKMISKLDNVAQQRAYLQLCNIYPEGQAMRWVMRMMPA